MRREKWPKKTLSKQRSLFRRKRSDLSLEEESSATTSITGLPFAFLRCFFNLVLVAAQSFFFQLLTPAMRFPIVVVWLCISRHRFLSGVGGRLSVVSRCLRKIISRKSYRVKSVLLFAGKCGGVEVGCVKDACQTSAPMTRRSFSGDF